MNNRIKTPLVELKFHVFFEEPFWIAICEKVEDYRLSACKITFGAEPKEYEVLEYVLKRWYQLKFSPFVEDSKRTKERINPKRLQRYVKKQVNDIGIGTKSQQALKLQQEQCKLKRQVLNHEKKEEEKERQFILRQQKKKEKHKGR